jgi:prevent-host-death family protein
MDTVAVHVAKTQLSKLFERVEAGEVIVIARGKQPVARLVPISERKPKRELGSMLGKVWVGPEFFEPLPDEELDAWINRPCESFWTRTPSSDGWQVPPAIRVAHSKNTQQGLQILGRTACAERIANGHAQERTAIVHVLAQGNRAASLLRGREQ